MKQAESSTGETPSDAELILQVRSGDREAFGVLYERHARAARALARQYVSPADAEDVVADAFGKMFEMLRRGAGPDAGFRPYLYTVVRHGAFDVRRGAARTRPTTDDEIESVLGRVASEEDPALAGFERSVIYRAYAELPERWREVLWYVLVDDLKPAQVAPVLGLSPNGVSALLYRAKEALRAGYLQQHLSHAPTDTCRSVNPLLGGYVRDSLSKRETAKIDEHLATCGTCSALVLELHDVAHGMKTVIAPLVLGAGGLALVGAGAPIGGLLAAAKAGAGAAAGGAPTATVGVASTGTISGAVSSAVSATTGAFASAAAAATGGSMAAGALAVAAVSMVAALQIGASGDADPVSADTVISATDGRELPPADRTEGKPVLPTDIEPGDTTSAYFVVDYTDDSKPLAPRETQELGLTVKNKGDAAATGTQLQVTLPDGLAMAVTEGPFGTGVGGRLVSSSTDATEDRDSEGTRTDVSPSPSASTRESSGVSGADDGEDSDESDARDDADDSDEPDGETQAMPGTSPSAPATAGTLPHGGPAACMPTEQSNVVLCSLGELAPGQQHNVTLPVEATSGGDYDVDAEVWADGIEPTGIDLPDRTVTPFGPELSAATDDVSLASPGTVGLPVRVTSTGDRSVPLGWSVDVALPGGVKPAADQPELSCTPGEMSNAWFCTPRAGTDAAAVQLEPGAAQDVTLRITTAMEISSEKPTDLGVANVSPVVPQGQARSASAALAVTSAWVDAGDGVGGVAASCLKEGGAGSAKAVVTGRYTNTTQRTVRVALEAAGGSASSGKDLDPGASTEVSVEDGLRVPAGQASFVLATVVDGQAYKTRVPAGEHKRAECYAPLWSTETSVQTQNAGSTIRLEGQVTNTSDETLTAAMAVPLGDTTKESVRLPVPPGRSVKLSVDTGRTQLAEGDVVFHLSRDGVDKDGDLPAKPFVPKNNPTRSYARAAIAPALGSAPLIAGACEFDAERDRSVQTFTVSADNTRSTLPVRFHVGEVTRTVPAGETMPIEFPVDWGTETVPLEAAGTVLEKLQVPFDSCADLTWPTETVSVSVAAQCVDHRVQLTATVENRTNRDWTGQLRRESTHEVGPAQQVGAGRTRVLELTRQTSISREGHVTVRLTGELEGRGYSVERSYFVDRQTCRFDICELVPSASTAAAADARLPRWLRFGACDEGPVADRT